MNPRHREYFRRNLLLWRAYLMEECAKISTFLNEKSTGETARLEQGAVEGYRVRKLKTLNRYPKLIDKINHALERIKDETYGYFEETGEEIGIRHLQAQPTATLCPAANQRREQMEGNKQAGHAQ